MSCCCAGKKDCETALSTLMVFGGLSVCSLAATLLMKKAPKKTETPTTIESYIPYVKERLKVVAEKLKISEDDILNILPHLKQSEEIKASSGDLSSFIDHTVLKANAKNSDIAQLCQEAIQNNFAAVCVNASNVAFCKKQLTGTKIGIASVVGFPLGATTTESKLFETNQAIDLGASEIDIVVNVGKLLDGDYEYVFEELKQAAELCIQKGAVLKVILECCLLNKELIADASIICMLAKCHFVKTSTGFSTSGAKLEDCKLMKAVVGNVGLVKAAGGIRDKQAAIQFIQEAKISRIGTSNGISIVANSSVTPTGY